MDFLSAYDNGGETLDRFTIVFITDGEGETCTYTMSKNATSPQGVCMFAGTNLVSLETPGIEMELLTLPVAVQQQIEALSS